MTIAHLSYVMCNHCGNPAEPEDDADQARAAAAAAGFSYVRSDTGRMVDLCPTCYHLWQMT